MLLQIAHKKDKESKPYCFLADGLVEYVALANASSTPGFYAGSTQFGVPYIEFTATEAAKGQVASFQGGKQISTNHLASAE